MKDSKTYTAKEITNYIADNAIELEQPGTRDTIQIWKSANGLTHTRGSMEYRDDEHEHVVTIELLNEFAPYSEADVQELVEFKLTEKA